jgi:hypothetical protein
VKIMLKTYPVNTITKIGISSLFTGGVKHLDIMVPGHIILAGDNEYYSFVEG